MDKANQLHSDVKRIVANNSENQSFRKLLQLLVLIREWKGLLSSSNYVQAVRHRQRIMVLVDELLQLQRAMPPEYASTFYRFVELELESINEFETYWATLAEHQISLFVAKLKSNKNRR